jgi:hypothetical protein
MSSYLMRSDEKVVVITIETGDIGGRLYGSS